MDIKELIQQTNAYSDWANRRYFAVAEGLTDEHLNQNDYPTLAAVREHWDKVGAEVRAFLEAQTNESLQGVITYNNLSGETFRVPLWQMFMHMTNHETHHRGELAGMFALMNVPHPEEEMIQYFLNLSGQKKF